MINENYYAPPSSHKELIYLAEFVRKLFGLRLDERIDPIDIIENKMPLIFKDFNYEIVDVKKMPNTYAYTEPKTKTIYIREDVYLDAIKGIGRPRFTICHEVGHYFKHFDLDIQFARSKSIQEVPIYCTTEWQADTFARHFLVPPKSIIGMSCEEIVEKFGVSREVAKNQLSYVSNNRF